MPVRSDPERCLASGDVIHLLCLPSAFCHFLSLTLMNLLSSLGSNAGTEVNRSHPHLSLHPHAFSLSLSLSLSLARSLPRSLSVRILCVCVSKCACLRVCVILYRVLYKRPVACQGQTLTQLTRSSSRHITGDILAYRLWSRAI